MRSKVWVKTIFFTLFLFYTLQSLNSYGQDGCVRLRVLSGGSIPIIINSLPKYQNGLVLNNWTQLTVHITQNCNFGTVMTPDIKTCNRWDLWVKTSTAAINSDGTNNLDINTIKLVATTDIPLATPNVLDLGTVEQKLIDGFNPVADVNGNVWITIYVGQGLTATPPTTPVLGKTPDYYFVDLIFDLRGNYP
ncbi:MAG: hypothetical protein AB9846_09275 [Tenuifilaceae bacterium]